MKQFGLAGREYNAANAKATSMIESAKTLLSERRDKLEDNVISLKGKAAECYVNITELEDRRKAFLSSPPQPKEAKRPCTQSPCPRQKPPGARQAEG